MPWSTRTFCELHETLSVQVCGYQAFFRLLHLLEREEPIGAGGDRQALDCELDLDNKVGVYCSHSPLPYGKSARLPSVLMP